MDATPLLKDLFRIPNSQLGVSDSVYHTFVLHLYIPHFYTIQLFSNPQEDSRYQNPQPYQT